MDKYLVFDQTYLKIVIIQILIYLFYLVLNKKPIINLLCIPIQNAEQLDMINSKISKNL